MKVFVGIARNLIRLQDFAVGGSKSLTTKPQVQTSARNTSLMAYHFSKPPSLAGKGNEYRPFLGDLYVS